MGTERLQLVVVGRGSSYISVCEKDANEGMSRQERKGGGMQTKG